VFAVATLLAGVGAVAVVGLSSGDGHDGEPLRIGKAVTAPALRRPALAFAATAMAAGALVTFLPAALQADTGLAAGALLLQALTAAAARWFTGRYSDRHQRPGRALALGLAVTAAALATLAAGTQPAMVLAGAAVFGAGFGVAQSASLTLMLNRVAPSGYATISAVWNMGYDLGWTVGAAGFGLLTTTTGYPAAFALTAAVTALALPLTRPARPAQSGGRTR
jgi:predicted MFS family arabinose efflux permease